MNSALLSTPDFYKTALELAPDPVIILDKDGYLLFVNKKAEELSGYSAEELVGKIFTKIGVVAVTSLPAVIANFSATVTGNTIRPFHMEIDKKDGGKATFEVTAEPLRLDNSISGSIAILRDISFRGE